MITFFKRKFSIIYLLISIPVLLFFLFLSIQFTKDKAVPVSSDSFTLEENTLYLYGYSDGTDTLSDSVAWWHSQTDDFYYFFLPSEAKGKTVQVAFSFSQTDSITWGPSVYHNQDVVKELCEGVIAVTIGDTAYPVKVVYTDETPALMLQAPMEEVDQILGAQASGHALVMDTADSYHYNGILSYIKGRGNSSFGYDKKPYQIRFPEKTGLCGMTKAKKWVLVPQYFDHTSLRNGLTFDLAAYLGIQYTPEYRFVNLYLNGTYNGLYLLTEKIEVSQARINIRDLDQFLTQNSEIDLSSLTTFGEKEYIPGTAKGYCLPSVPDDISGGYLLELELSERYSSAGSCGFVTNRGQAVIIKSPEYAGYEEVSYIQNWYQEFEDALYSADGYNPSNGKHYTEYLDLSSAASKYLLEEWIKNPDAGKTSQFFYKPADSVSTHMFAGPVWDYDLAYGALVAFSHPEGLWASYLDETCNIYEALYQQEDFKEEVKLQYQNKILPFFKEQAFSYLDTCSAKYLTSSYLSAIRWNLYNTTDEQEIDDFYTSDLTALKQFLSARTSYLTDLWQKETPTHDVYVDVSTCDYFYLGTDNHVSVLDGQCIYFLYAPVKYGYDFVGWQNQATKEMFDLTTPIKEDGIVLEPVFSPTATSS